MKGSIVPWTAAALLIAVSGCGVSKAEKLDLLDAVKEETTEVQLESKGYGSEAEEAAAFIARREEGFVKIRELLQKTLSDDAESLDHFYLSGLLDEIREKEGMSFGRAKRMTEKRLGQLKTRIKQL